MSIPHGINFNEVLNITVISGTAYDGTDYYPLPYIDVIDAKNQINVILTNTNIVITGGGGMDQPVITNGIIILQWLVN
jgi:hypothetical protein